MHRDYQLCQFMSLNKVNDRHWIFFHQFFDTHFYELGIKFSSFSSPHLIFITVTGDCWHKNHLKVNLIYFRDILLLGLRYVIGNVPNPPFVPRKLVKTRKFWANQWETAVKWTSLDFFLLKIQPSLTRVWVDISLI